MRWFARVRGGSLDRRLAAGEDSSRSALLAARATQLGRRSTRLRIARGIEGLTLAWEEPLRRFRALPRQAAVAKNRLALLELAALLRRPGPLYVRGIAAARLMLVDGTGPIYTDGHGEALAAQLGTVSALLQG